MKKLETASASAVRRSAHELLESAVAGELADWHVDLAGLPATADYVAQLTRTRFPNGNVPMHSRWRHFTFNGQDLWPPMRALAISRVRTEFDLAVTSVLLDAGAGPTWRYRDETTGLVAARSEGLALAGLRWFANGGFSSDPDNPLRADATGLMRVNAAALNEAFQVSAENPLVGAEQRAALLNRLGKVVHSRPDVFTDARVGGLFDYLVRHHSEGKTLRAESILETLLDAFGPIWADRPKLNGVSLGDCWPHPAVSGGYVPLHKLSQWLCYSLIEPLQDAGLHIVALEELTGLAEYRNGGLFTDMGVLVPREAGALTASHAVSDPFVVGWRAITVALLDRLAPLVGERLGLPNDSFLLARVLEGGTWAAGRQLARERRADGGPPFQIQSDGTVL